LVSIATIEEVLVLITNQITANNKLIKMNKKLLLDKEAQNERLNALITTNTIEILDKINPQSNKEGNNNIIKSYKKFIHTAKQEFFININIIKGYDESIAKITFQINEMQENYSPTGFATPLDLGPQNKASVYQNGILIEDNTNTEITINPNQETVSDSEKIRLLRIQLSKFTNRYNLEFITVQVKNKVGATKVQKQIETGKYSGAIGHVLNPKTENPVSSQEANSMSLNLDNIPQTLSKLFERN
jgi:hypothetical protein